MASAEIDVETFMSSITMKLDKLTADLDTVCINKVSEKHRKVNEEAYTPRLVSIGPFHHGKIQLQAMESYKLSCLQSFRSWYMVNIADLVKYAADMESSVRKCYEGIIKFSSTKFAEIILLDGVFIVVLLLKNQIWQMVEPNDQIFVNRWMASDVLHDMLLLENQLPMNFTAGIFNFVDSDSVFGLSFIELCNEYFKKMRNTRRLRLTDSCGRARHLVELLLYLHQPSRPKESQPSHVGILISLPQSARELQAAGVRLKHTTGERLLGVSFSVTQGVLKIPQLTVDDSTETFFRNLIAFEQCGHSPKNISSYVILMDALINTAKDVDVLVQHKIIENLLGESQLVADLFNNLHKEVVLDKRNFYFAEMCEDLSQYRRCYLYKWRWPWLQWKEELVTRYFSSSWAFLSLLGALVLLILTMLQTVCSVVSIR